MGAEWLRAWEVVLQSPVAVALLLLGAVLVLGWIQYRWVRALHEENQELNRWIREHLEAQADLGQVHEHLRAFLDLYGQLRRPTHPPDPGAHPPVAARAGAEGAAPGAAGRGAEGGDGKEP